jgi:hypothetical protein
MNVFIAKKLHVPGVVCMVFSKPKPMEQFFPEFKRLFGNVPRVEDITFVNRVEKFYTPWKNLDFEGLYDDLDKSSDITSFFIITHKKGKVATKPAKIPSYCENNVDDDDSDCETVPPPPTSNLVEDPQLSMNLQRFCAMMICPFPSESNVMIEVFASGVLNVAGIPNEEYFLRIKQFIEIKLAPILSNNSM